MGGLYGGFWLVEESDFDPELSAGSPSSLESDLTKYKQTTVEDRVVKFRIRTYPGKFQKLKKKCKFLAKSLAVFSLLLSAFLLFKKLKTKNGNLEKFLKISNLKT